MGSREGIWVVVVLVVWVRRRIGRVSIVVAPVLTLVRLVNGQVRIIHKLRCLKTDLWIARHGKKDS